MRTHLLLAILSAILLSSFPSLQAAVQVVYTYNNEFSTNQPGGPIVNAVTITVGDTVRWVRLQGNHTTTSVSGSTEQWNSELNNQITEFQRQFNTPGTFWYYCIPHGTDNGDGTASGMHGRITVISADAGACCMPDGSCMLTTSSGCSDMGGVFQGTGTNCTPNPCAAGEISITLQASKDNSIYAESGTVSNGGGITIFTGIRQGNIRRSLVAFDPSAIPYGAVITNVELRMVSTVLNTSQLVSLHRVNANWGEGTAAGNLNSGAAAGTGDATWTQRQFNVAAWNTAGGDFQATASASTTVSNTGLVSWTSAAMLGDVEMWMSMPSMAHGWIIHANEVNNNQNVTFASRENATDNDRPQLVITYTFPASSGACCVPDGQCTVNTEGDCTALGGTWQGEGTNCSMVVCPIELTPFLDPLPLPGVAQPASGNAGGAAHYNIAMTEQFQQLHSQLPQTRVWGYNGGYPGPTIEARRGEQVTVTWMNDLRVSETNALRSEHVLHVDECLHGPHTTGHAPVAVVHLHGGKVAPESDGDPEAAFPPGQQSPLYIYPNDQPAATLWYHDHALGITRLNVMMGLAGFYLLRDDAEDALGLPSGPYEIPLAIQDRSFNADGSLFYNHTWHEHFFGDKIVVNGKVWPYHNVQQGKYRFRIVNGSNSRTYTLALSNNATFWQIGTDQGLMNAPVPMNSLTILPGERADVVIDFAAYAPGTEIILTNSAPAPFPGSPGVGVVPDVMKFIVQAGAGHTAPLPTVLANVPQLQTSEVFVERDMNLVLTPNYCDDHDSPMWTINGLMWDDITEEPILGATEIWRWINNSGIDHPMHMHLVLGQVLDRQEIDANGEPFGPVYPPAPNEIGWKDTWNAPTGFVTRVIAKFDGFTGIYPYHCHILEHEDHEMMRQFNVLPPVRVAVQAMLEGPFNSGTGLMNDALRVQGLLPLTEPYSAMGYPLRGGAGTTTSMDVLAVNGPAAVVDWVVVELRDPVLPDSVVRTRPALLLCNGEIVSTDGVSPLAFDLPAGPYHVAVRHRNHLGVMTALPLQLDDAAQPVDLTNTTTVTWGLEARKNITGTMALWAGNVLRDHLLKYTGDDNDRDPILQTIGGSIPTNIITGYHQEDVNLDGNVKYSGAGNDRDPILVNIGGVIPTEVRVEQVP